MISAHYRQWIIGGLIWATLFFLSRNLFLGVSFLMLLFSLAGLFAAYLGFLYAPWKTPWILSVVKVLKICTLIGFCVVLISFLIIEFKIWRGGKSAPQKDTECLVVLGAGVYGTRPSASLRSRMNAALEYLSAHPNVSAILSGGQGPGEDITEAEAMRRFFTENGIAEDRLILEEKSTDTVENLTNSFALAEANGFSNLTIVTNEFHLYRSCRLAEKWAGRWDESQPPSPSEVCFPYPAICENIAAFF